MAWRCASPSPAAASPSSGATARRGFGDGLALQAINPKAYVVNTALFTGFAFEGMSLGAETAWKFVLINLVWIPIHLAWLAAGIALDNLALAPRRQRLVNIAMALSLLAVVALALVAGRT